MTRSEFFASLGVGPAAVVEAATIQELPAKQPGEPALVAIVFPHSISVAGLDNLKAALAPHEKAHNIKFLVFDCGPQLIRLT